MGLIAAASLIWLWLAYQLLFPFTVDTSPWVTPTSRGWASHPAGAARSGHPAEGAVGACR
ncbi:hypothetical protein ACIRO3_25515 [Streptomyces sp. NPDC102278]|uniref:hypothetical protein n=1 Tax=Streptomyces sp. NPDC102278 TaxID=3366152 RepID=UPI00381CCE62